MISPLTVDLPDSVRSDLLHAAGLAWEHALPYGYMERPSPNKWAGRPTGGVYAVVWHITDGSGGSALSWLTNPASKVSSNDLVMESGSVISVVPGLDTAWANGILQAPRLEFPVIARIVASGVNPNKRTHSIEVAGKSSQGRGGSLNDRQIAALIVRTAQACLFHSLKADVDHILRHAYFTAIDRANCPGFSRAEMVTWVAATDWLTREWRGW